MADVFTKAKRSSVMSRIRGTGNKNTELRLIVIMRAHGITGWQRGSMLTGKPDFVFNKLKLAVFVDGCFWHGCPQHGTKPKQKARFWREKIARNQARDRLVNRALRTSGWRVLRIWEHALASRRVPHTLARLCQALNENEMKCAVVSAARRIRRNAKTACLARRQPATHHARLLINS